MNLLVGPFLLPLNASLGALLGVFFIGRFPQQQPAKISHHIGVPSSLVPSLCVLDILVKPFTLFFTIRPQVFGKVVRMGVQEMHFQAHVTALFFEGIEHPGSNILIVLIPPIPQEFENNILEGVPGFFFLLRHRFSECCI